jgi:hypothetical protein
MRYRSAVLALLATTLLVAAFYGWWRPPRPRAEVGEDEGRVPEASEPPVLPSPSPAAAPALTELQPTLDVVFDGTLVVDRASRPAYVAGDFNGDGVADLAVAVRLRSRDTLPRLQAEVSRWSLQDATAAHDLGRRPDPVTVAPDDLLLAVVHGGGAPAWRNPENRTGYIVANAVESSLAARPLDTVPDAIRMKVLRPHTGDVLVASRRGRPGVTVFTGASYAWVALDAGRTDGRKGRD